MFTPVEAKKTYTKYTAGVYQKLCLGRPKKEQENKIKWDPPRMKKRRKSVNKIALLLNLAIFDSFLQFSQGRGFY